MRRGTVVVAAVVVCAATAAQWLPERKKKRRLKRMFFSMAVAAHCCCSIFLVFSSILVVLIRGMRLLLRLYRRSPLPDHRVHVSPFSHLHFHMYFRSGLVSSSQNTQLLSLASVPHPQLGTAAQRLSVVYAFGIHSIERYIAGHVIISRFEGTNPFAAVSRSVYAAIRTFNRQRAWWKNEAKRICFFFFFTFQIMLLSPQITNSCVQIDFFLVINIIFPKPTLLESFCDVAEWYFWRLRHTYKKNTYDYPVATLCSAFYDRRQWCEMRVDGL